MGRIAAPGDGEVTQRSAARPPKENPGPPRGQRLRRRRCALTVAHEVCTAEEFERLTPAEQDAHFDASIVTNLTDVSEALVDRVRHRLEAHVAESDTPTRT